MKLHQLRYVLAVVETGSFTAAARMMHVAQPSLSQQIIALERELGVTLFVRDPGQVTVTDAGRAFVKEAAICVTAADRAREAARRASDEAPTRIDVATVTSLAMSLIPRAIGAFRASQPDCAIHVREVNHHRIVERLVLQGLAEVGVGPAPHGWPGEESHLGWDELRLVLPEGDPLIEADEPVALVEVVDRDWVLCEQNHGLRHIVDLLFNDIGLHPRAATETGQIESAIQLAAAGLGPTIVPGHAVARNPAIRSVSLDPPVAWRLAAFTHRGRSSAVDAFAEALGHTGLLEAMPPGAVELEPGRLPMPLVSPDLAV